MRAWQLLSARNPLWRVAGGLLTLSIVGVTAVYVARGPRPLKPTTEGSLFGPTGTQGRFGTVTEPLGKGLFSLSYETIQGKEKDLHLQTVSGRLEEPETVWTMLSPAAQKAGTVWTLMGPMNIEAKAPGKPELLGKGAIAAAGPALGWELGVWQGLSPLVWDDFQGNGRGRWNLPAGWRRGTDGRFTVEHGPVRWTAADPGALVSLEAASMAAALGFREGRLQGVTAVANGGDLQAQVVDILPERIHFNGPIGFRRDDGWRGGASQGQAPRPADGKAFDRVEFRDFRAQRALEGGLETVQADGARWTSAGLRLEGGVLLAQPLEEEAKDGKRLILRAPRILQRNAAGPDLPAELPIGESWAEPQAVLTWGVRSLSSPRIEVRRQQRQWKLLAPVQGRGEMGTFQAGEGQGNPLRWQFAGPVQAELADGSRLRAETLTWEQSVWTLQGHPVTWTRLRQRLSGPRLVRRDDSIQFPSGLAGALATLEGDLTLRADQGTARKTQILLEGRVECQGAAWRLQAERISVTLGPGNIVKQVTANGSVVLRGRMGEGRGDALDLDLERKAAHWHGGVKGLAEVQP